LQDHEGPEGYYDYYYLIGISSMYVGGGGGGGGGEPINAITGEEGFLAGAANPLVGTYTTVDRSTVENTIKTELGLGTLSATAQRILDQGCLGVVKLMMRTTRNGTVYMPGAKYPEDAPVPIYGPVKAFLTIEDCNAWSPGGGREVVYIKFGSSWKGGQAPTPSGVYNEVPLDSVNNISVGASGTGNNWVTKVGDKWIGVTEGVTNPANRAAMQGQVYDSLADVNMAIRSQVRIFVKRIVPE
jgi:hypothetical protein